MLRRAHSAGMQNKFPLCLNLLLCLPHSDRYICHCVGAAQVTSVPALLWSCTTRRMRNLSSSHNAYATWPPQGPIRAGRHCMWHANRLLYSLPDYVACKCVCICVCVCESFLLFLLWLCNCMANKLPHQRHQRQSWHV